MDAYTWDTYQVIEDQGLLDDVGTKPWDAGGKSLLLLQRPTLLIFVLVHEKLHFISHLPQNVMGEQLIAQLFRSIPEKSWLFKYGRVPLSFALSQWVWEVRGQIS
jgi:mitochondrial transcription factor 1